MKYHNSLPAITLAFLSITFAVFAQAPQENAQKIKQEQVQKLEKSAQEFLKERKFEDAAKVFRSLAEDSELDLNRRFSFYVRLAELYADQLKDPKKAKELNAMLLTMPFTPEQKTQTTFRMARNCEALKQNAEAAGLERSIYANPELRLKDRIQAFSITARRIGMDKKADKKPMWEQLQLFLKEKELTPEQFAALHMIAVRYGESLEQKKGSAELILAKGDTSIHARSEAACLLAESLVRANDNPAAEAILRKVLADKDMKGAALENLIKSLGAVLNYQDKQKERLALYEETIKQYPNSKTTVLPLLADAYLANDMFPKAIQLMRDQKDIPGEIRILYQTGKHAEAKKMALDILKDEKQPEQTRRNMFGYFCDDTTNLWTSNTQPADRALNREIRKEYSSFYAEKGYLQRNQVAAAMWERNHLYAAELLEPFYKAGKLSYGDCYDYIQALAGLKKLKEASDIALAQSKDKKFNAIERYQFALLSALLSVNKNDMKVAFSATNATFANEPTVTQNIHSQSLLNAGKTFMLANESERAEEAYNIRNSILKQHPEKLYTLTWQETPVTGPADMIPKGKPLDVQFLDRVYQGNLDFMVTDVSTGNRAAATDEAAKKDNYTEFRAVCDVNGIHLLFNTHDELAREVEARRLGAGSYEMYLAPGANQPYTCFLQNLQTGEMTVWQTSYDSQKHTRIKADDYSRFRSQHDFFDTGYRSYLFLSWDFFFDKLPEKDDRWEFDNIQWGRSGGLSWSGTRVIHGRSTWGKLAFEITPAQLIRIKKKIIDRSIAEYKKQKWTGISHHGIFDKWKDDVLGDLKFYQEILLPLQQKLDSYLAMVKPDMDDATVEKVYQEALPFWKNLPFITEKLRRDYLAEQLSK